MAGLPLPSAIVCVDPPLLPRAPSSGSNPILSCAAARPHWVGVVDSRLWSSSIVVLTKQLAKPPAAVPPAMIVFCASTPEPKDSRLPENPLEEFDASVTLARRRLGLVALYRS